MGVTPEDFNAEQSLLATIIQFPDVIPDVGKRIQPKDFFHPRNQLTYEAALALYNEGNPVSASSVLSELDRRKQLNRVGAPYLTELIQIPVTAGGVNYFIGIVFDKARLRKIKDLSVRLDQATELDADQAIEAVHTFLLEADVDKGDEGDDFDAAYQSWLDWYESDSVAIPTPWPGVNSLLLGGLHRGRLYTVAGRPGAGKSAFCLNVLSQAAKAGFRGVVYSMEMGKEECMSRILSAATNVPLKNLFLHRLTADDRQKIDNFATNKTRPYMKINDNPSQTIESIMADCRARKRHGLDLVIIDHSLLLNPSRKNEPLHQQVTHVVRQSKLLARRLDVSVCLLHQMNREKEQHQRRKPVMADLREGGEMDSDAIIVLDRNSDERPGEIMAYLIKNRYGPADRSAVLLDELNYGRLGAA